MKVAFVGNFAVPYSTECDYLWTLRERLGHEVVTIQENGAIGEQIEEAALAADVLFWVHTHGWETVGKPVQQVLETLRARNVLTFSYHLDLWMGIDRQRDLDRDPFWRGIQYFFTVDKLMADYLNSRDDMPRSFFVRPGVVERDCYLADPRPDLLQDVIFVGSRGYHPEWQYRPQLIDWLTHTYGPRFTHWGGDGAGVMRGHDLNQLFASAKVVVGDTLCLDFKYPYYVSDRLYETIGRGGFLIQPYIEGLEEGFVEYENIVCYKYGDFEHLRYLIDYYLEHDDDRLYTRDDGHAFVKSSCTYTNRLAEIFELLK